MKERCKDGRECWKEENINNEKKGERKGGILCEKDGNKSVYKRIRKIATDLMDSVNDVDDDIILLCLFVVNLKVCGKNEVDTAEG